MSHLLIRQNLIVPFIPRWVFVIVAFIISYNKIHQYVDKHYFMGMALVFIFMFVLLFFLFTSRHQIEIDPESKTIHPHIWVMGYKIGGKKTFSGIEKIFVNKVKQSQKLYTPFNYSTKYFGMIYIEENLYKSFLKFDTGEKMVLIENQDRDQLFEQLSRYEAILNVRVYDNTVY
jgi:hypothetical protein